MSKAQATLPLAIPDVQVLKTEFNEMAHTVPKIRMKSKPAI